MGRLFEGAAARAAGLKLAMAAAVCVWLSCGPAAAQSCAGSTSPCFQGLGFLGTGDVSYAYGISADGSTVVGGSYPTPSPSNTVPVSWTNGTITALASVPNEGPGVATAASSDGSVIVGFASINGPQELMSWTNGTPTVIGLPPGGSYGYAEAVSADGTIVAGYGNDTTSGQTAFTWSNGTFTPLGGNQYTFAYGMSADGSVVVGGTGVNGNNYPNTAARWVNGTFTNLGIMPNGTTAFANAVSADGKVIAGQSTFDFGFVPQAFLWQGGSFEALGFLPNGENSSAVALSADGYVVVGYCTDQFAQVQAIRRLRGGQMQSIQDLLTAAGIDTTGWQLQYANGVSADGTTIVGTGIDPNGNTQAWMARLPIVAAAMHDFNGDNNSDLIWRDAAGNLSIWLLSPGHLKNYAGYASPGATWSIIGQRDFNGDGDADILWRDQSGNVAMWFMSGLAITPGAGIGLVPPNWTVYGTGDLNGDSKGDILWRDTSGDTAIWFMNGSQIASTASLGNVASKWTLIGDDNNGDIFWHDNAGN